MEHHVQIKRFAAGGSNYFFVLILLAGCAASVSGFRTVCRNESIVATVVVEEDCYVSWLWSECSREVNKTIVKEVCYNLTAGQELPRLTTPPPLPQKNINIEVTAVVTPGLPLHSTGTQKATVAPPSGASKKKPGVVRCWNETLVVAAYEEDTCVLSWMWNGCWRPVNKTVVQEICSDGSHPMYGQSGRKGESLFKDDEDDDGQGKLTDAEILSVAAIVTLAAAIAITVATIMARQRLRKRKHGGAGEELKVTNRHATNSAQATPSSPLLQTVYVPADESKGTLPSSTLLQKGANSADASEHSELSNLATPLPLSIKDDKTPSYCGGEVEGLTDTHADAAAEQHAYGAAAWDGCRESRA